MERALRVDLADPRLLMITLTRDRRACTRRRKESISLEGGTPDSSWQSSSGARHREFRADCRSLVDRGPSSSRRLSGRA